MSIRNATETHQVFAQAASEGDVERLVSMYEADAVVVEQNGELTVGIDAIRRHLEQLVALNPKMRIETSRVFERGDLALLCSRWTAAVTAPDGTPINLDCRGSEIARRQPDGSWRLLIDNPWGIDLHE